MVMMRVMNDRMQRAREHMASKAREDAAKADARIMDQNPVTALDV